jgi:seryl-tRNA(Sec) selenium transferase
MQEELNEKTIALAVRTTKMTVSVLKAAMRKFLEEQGKQKQKVQTMVEKRNQPSEGKQTMKQLMKQNAELTNIEVTDGNIRSFERVARKYHIDFSLKKDNSMTPPKYIVFFKAKDVDVMTTAFKEYSAKELKKTKKPSVLKRLRKTQNVQKKQQRSREKTKQKGREPSR